MFKNLTPGAVGLGGPLSEIMPLARAVGFEGIDAQLGDAPDGLKRLYEEHGMRVGCMGFPVEFRRDEGTYEEGLATLEAKVRAAAEVGCCRCATYLRPWSEDLTYEENFAQHVARLRPAAEILREYGFRLGLEFVGPKTSRDGHQFAGLHTLDHVLDLAEAIGTGNVGVLLDAWHWYTSHGTPADLKKLTNELIVQVHVNDAPAGIDVDEQIDNVRDLPGATGVIDIATFLGALRDLDYDGPVTPEPFVAELRQMDRDEAARTIGAAMDTIWDLAGLT